MKTQNIHKNVCANNNIDRGKIKRELSLSLTFFLSFYSSTVCLLNTARTLFLCLCYEYAAQSKTSNKKA